MFLKKVQGEPGQYLPDYWRRRFESIVVQIIVVVFSTDNAVFSEQSRRPVEAFVKREPCIKRRPQDG